MSWPEHKQQYGSFEWYTPQYIIQSLGEFDLDPCAPESPPFKIAENTYTGVQMGLMQPWFGRVWCNPPYGKETMHWLSKCAEHGNALCLIFARTDTQAFQNLVFRKATSVLFIKGRINFLNKGVQKKGTAASASCIVGFGEDNARALDVCGLGYNVRLR